MATTIEMATEQLQTFAEKLADRIDEAVQGSPQTQVGVGLGRPEERVRKVYEAYIKRIKSEEDRAELVRLLSTMLRE